MNQWWLLLLPIAGGFGLKLLEKLLGRGKEQRDSNIAEKRLVLNGRAVTAQERVAEATSLATAVDILAEAVDTSEGMRKRDNEDCDKKLDRMGRQIAALKTKVEAIG